MAAPQRPATLLDAHARLHASSRGDLLSMAASPPSVGMDDVGLSDFNDGEHTFAPTPAQVPAAAFSRQPSAADVDPEESSAVYLALAKARVNPPPLQKRNSRVAARLAKRKAEEGDAGSASAADGSAGDGAPDSPPNTSQFV